MRSSHAGGKLQNSRQDLLGSGHTFPIGLYLVFDRRPAGGVHFATELQCTNGPRLPVQEIAAGRLSAKRHARQHFFNRRGASQAASEDRMERTLETGTMAGTALEPSPLDLAQVEVAVDAAGQATFSLPIDVPPGI